MGSLRRQHDRHDGDDHGDTHSNHRRSMVGWRRSLSTNQPCTDRAPNKHGKRHRLPAIGKVTSQANSTTTPTMKRRWPGSECCDRLKATEAEPATTHDTTPP